MRILLLTQWFDPEPCFKGLQFAKALQSRGHEVEVLTGFPNYPGGTVYSGYRIRLWQKECMDGVPVVRVPLYPSHSRSAFGRIANYASFALMAATLGLALTQRADVVYVYHPPATVGLPAMLFRLLRRCRLVYDIQDLWPDTLAATGMLSNNLAQAVIGLWCRLVYRASNRLVVLSPGFKRRLIDRGVPAEKIEVIYNWADESTPTGFGELPADELRSLAGKFNILFAGNLGAAQALDTVLEAARLVEQSRPDIQFVFVGDGIQRPRLQDVVRDRGITNVLFLPRRTPREVQALYGKVDALLVHLRDDELFTITIPSKTQAYLLAGLPIIMAVRGDAAGLVREAKAGVTCDSENAAQLGNVTIELGSLSADQRRAMGDAGRSFYDQKLSLSKGVDHFLHVFSEVASRGGDSRSTAV